MALSLDGFISGSHIDTKSHLRRIARLGYKDDRRNPWGGSCHFFNYIVVLQLLQLFFKLFPKMERDASMLLYHRLDGFIDVQLDLSFLKLSNSFE